MKVKSTINASRIEEKASLKEVAFRIYDKFGMLLILTILIILITLAKPNFLSLTNLTNIVRQMSFIALIALGSTAIIVIKGIDLSPGSVMAVSAVVAASLAHPGQYPIIVPVVAGLVAGMLCGLLSGFIIAKSGIPPFIATLGMYTAARGVAMLYTNGKPIGDFSDEFIWLGAGRVLGVPVPILILAVMAIFSYIILNNTKFGRHVYALGGNEEAAIISGINVTRIKIIIFAYGGLLAGVAGISLAARIQSGQPSMGVGYELDAIASAVIGGTSLSSGGIGTIQGTIIGALIIGVINNGMDLMNINSYWQSIVKGTIIILAVILDKQKSKYAK